MPDPYSVLGVSPSATRAEIAHAYRRQLRDHHPDRRAGSAHSGADELLDQILGAYALLRDPHRRAAYDRAHSNEHPTPTRIRVRHIDTTEDQSPPLWVGPVRWHR